LETFHQVTQPVVDHYTNEGKLRKVNAELDADAIFEEIKKILNNEQPASPKVEPPHHKNELDIDRINSTVDKIVHNVIDMASNHMEVKQDVSVTLRDVIKDLIHEMIPDEESGFSFLQYKHLELYHGPTQLISLDESLTDESEFEDKAQQDPKKKKKIKSDKKKATDEKGSPEKIKHGEIIIRASAGDKIDIRADDNNDTVISNLNLSEIIIRNVDTKLLINVIKDKPDSGMALSIVGQAYIRDLSGTIKAKDFRGIVLIKNDLTPYI
jgi:hypothetical protein